MPNGAGHTLNLPYELRIGLRYTRAGRRARRRNRFISFISGISMLGIALGVMALIVVLSVMNGFVSQVRDRMLSVVSHVEVFAIDGALADWKGVAEATRRHPEVVGAAPYVNAQALLTRGDSVRGVLVRGVDPVAEPEVSEFATLVRGAPLKALADGEFGIVLGGELARALGVALGEKITLMAPQGQVTPAGVVPRLKQFTVVGTFDSGHFEYDSALALIHIGDAQRLFRVDGPTGVRLKLKDMQRAQEVAAELAQSLPPGMIVRDWTRQNRTWFAAVQVEKRMMFIILALIVAVAAFNPLSTLVMTVTEKQSDIAILRTLGASPSCTMKTAMMLEGLAPRVRRMAMSDCFSVTVITSVETRLNAATATMSARMMNIIRFSTCTAANQVRFCRVQSRTIIPGGNACASSAATSCARCMSLSFRRTPVGPSTRKSRCASPMWISASALSYSKWPESNVPTTVNCFNRGTTPAGVTCPCGAISVTFSPSATPSARASSPPSTMPNSPSASALSGAPRTSVANSDTCGSAAGSTPRIRTPRTLSPRVSSAWALTYGAAPTTSGFLRAASATPFQSASAPSIANTSTCETTDSMRSRTCETKPFITDSTTISAITPSAMPSIEMPEMNEMNLLRRRARRPARV